jgi:sec-independent protein translocase protein TatA
LVLFGAGKLPRVMGDLAKGIKTFKAGMKDEIADAGAAPADEVKRPEPAAARQDDNVRG